MAYYLQPQANIETVLKIASYNIHNPKLYAQCIFTWTESNEGQCKSVLSSLLTVYRQHNIVHQS